MKKTLIFILVVTVLLVYKFMWADRPFNKAKWAKDPSKRYLMTNDLIKSKMLIGMTKTQITNLLTNDCKHCSDSSNSWMYYTKVEKGWSDAEIEILDILFEDGIAHQISVRD